MTSSDSPSEDCLRPGTALLQGQFLIERFLNAGGFGMTYLARDSLDRLVVLKECYPNTMVCRSGEIVRARTRALQPEFDTVVRLFGQEARRLAHLRHPNIVGVHQVFEDLGTAYMALDFIEGQDLLDVIETEPERLGSSEIKSILQKVLKAVGHVHDQKILHRDISPDNILLRSDGEPILIDFGAARDQARRSSRVLSSLHVVKDGYSPQEFYMAGTTQGPASDLYSMGATFYHLILGSPPPNSHVRLAALAAKEPDPYTPLNGRVDAFDPAFLAAIDKALNVFPKDRIQSAADWLDQIDHVRRRKVLVEKAAQDRKIEESIDRLVKETNMEVLRARVNDAESEARMRAQTEAREDALAREKAKIRSSALREAVPAPSRTLVLSGPKPTDSEYDEEDDLSDWLLDDAEDSDAQEPDTIPEEEAHSPDASGVSGPHPAAGRREKATHRPSLWRRMFASRFRLSRTDGQRDFKEAET